MWCGAKNVTKEHVLPQWTRRVVNPTLHVRSETIWLPAFEGPRTVEKQGTTFTKQPRIACLSCNGGWMSAMEQRSMPALKPLIVGTKRHIDASEAKVIAAWASKTAYVSQAVGQYFSSPEERRAFMQNPYEPPTSTQVWLGRWRGGNGADIWTHAWLLSGAGLPPVATDPLNSHLTMFAIGHLVIVVAATPDPDFAGYGPRGIWSYGLVGIWPLGRSHASWPPRLQLNPKQVLALRVSFKQGLGERDRPASGPPV